MIELIRSGNPCQTDDKQGNCAAKYRPWYSPQYFNRRHEVFFLILKTMRQRAAGEFRITIFAIK